jgi:hypothetical protein
MGRARHIGGRDIWRAAGALPRTPEYFCREDGVWISAAVPSAAG